MGLNKRKIITLFCAAGLLSAVFASGFFLGKSQAEYIVFPPSDVDMSLFWESWKTLQKKYLNKEEIDPQKMIYGAIGGMVKSLGDPYTVFFNPEENKRFMEDVSGKFEGVGMEIGIRKGQLQIIAPLEGTPAQKIGLRAGDKILKINDTLNSDISVEEAVNLIRGQKGTHVTLTISRNGWDSPKEFKITRDVIQVPSLKWELKSTPEGESVAYIKIYQFSAKAGSDFQKAAAEILKSPAKKIIVDLRNNPGGYLEVAQDISGWFLKNGDIVVIEDFGGKREKKDYKSSGPSKFTEYPMIILINQGSASGSEILAGALRDNRGVKLLGEKSFGKGSVQEVSDLKGGSSLKITIAKWLTPKGELINEKGLEPDINVEMTDQDYDEEKDPQLNKALEELVKIR